MSLVPSSSTRQTPRFLPGLDFQLVNTLSGFGGPALWKATEAFPSRCLGLRTRESVGLPYGPSLEAGTESFRFQATGYR